MTLSEMVSAYELKITNLTIGLVSVSASILDLQEQKGEADDTISEIVSDTNEWGTAKAAVSGAAYSWCTSGSYGVSNLTEWAVVSGACSAAHIITYTWSDVTSSGEPEQWTRKLDFDEIYDHINDSVDVNGTYGLEANIVNLQTAESVLEADKDKYEDLVETYERYK